MNPDTEIPPTLAALAEAHDASIHTDRDGDFALLRRHYDDEGRRELRHAPDPCDFHPLARWLAWTPEQVAAAIA